MPFFRKERRHLIVFALLVFFHLFLISIQIPLGERTSLFERGLFALLTPFQRAAASVSHGVSQVWNNYFYLRQVRLQNQKMRDELFNLRQENSLLRNLAEKMREEAGLRASVEPLFSSFKTASIVGFDPSNVFRSILINRGERDGIRKDMPVLDGLGRVVGRVIGPITARSARVQLITDEQCGIGVFTQNTKVIGVLKGNGQGGCLLDYVLSTNQEISVEEDVLTSGFDDMFPSGLRVGKITTVEKGTSLFKKISVQPYFDLRKLKRVAVLTGDVKEF